MDCLDRFHLYYIVHLLYYIEKRGQVVRLPARSIIAGRNIKVKTSFKTSYTPLQVNRCRI